jgi:HEAT repeat protein
MTPISCAARRNAPNPVTRIQGRDHRTATPAMLALLVFASMGCQKERIPPALEVLPKAAVSHPTPLGTAPLQLDALTRELKDPDPMVRYTAAARVSEKLSTTDVSPSARQALFDLIANSQEPGGVRLWAARAVAKIDPEAATARFIELDAKQAPVDDDAWLILGPRALPYLSSRCTASACPTALLLKVALIVGAAADDPASRALLPLLLRESTRSEQHRVIVYRTLGAFGPGLTSELEAAKTHPDADVRKAAVAALGTIE